MVGEGREGEGKGEEERGERGTGRYIQVLRGHSSKALVTGADRDISGSSMHLMHSMQPKTGLAMKPRELRISWQVSFLIFLGLLSSARGRRWMRYRLQANFTYVCGKQNYGAGYK